MWHSFACMENAVELERADVAAQRKPAPATKRCPAAADLHLGAWTKPKVQKKNLSVYETLFDTA